MTKKDLTCGGSHKGAKFAHITKVHPFGCNFCIRSINTEEDRPGVAGSIMDADAAVEHVLNVTKDSAITVVGVAGPGDSLANEATFEFFEKINEVKPDLIKCMSTNGLLLPKYAERIAELGTASLSMKAKHTKGLKQLRFSPEINWKESKRLQILV